MNSKKFGIILLLTILAKIFLAWAIPVFGDESYYWFWGQHVQLSYFDHPGMVGWMTWLGAKIQFLPAPLLVRWPFIFLSSLSLFFYWQILQESKQIDFKFSIWLVAFYLLNPLLGVGGILATPDVPLVFFWTLSYWIFLSILKKQRTIDYVFLGASLGLGLCSKYHIVLFPISIILALALSKRMTEINLKKLSLTFCAGIFFSLPVLIWNYKNDWVSFAFQLNHGFQGKSYSVIWTITYLAGQILLFNPLLMYQLFLNLRKSIAQKAAIANWSFFCLSSLKASVEANWPVTAHISGLAALQDAKNRQFLRPALTYSILIWIIFFGFYFTEFGQQKINKIPTTLTAENIWPKISKYSPIYGPTYQMSSLLQLTSGRQILKLNELSRIDFYDSGLFPMPTEKLFYALKYNTSDWPQWTNRAQKTAVEFFPDQKLTLYRVTYE